MGRQMSCELYRLANAAAVWLIASALVTHAQVRRPAERANESAKVPMQISLQVGGTAYAFSGSGSCRSAARASIYDMQAAMWTVEQEGDAKSLTLTVWHPNSGPADMMSLSVTAGGKSHRVDTVKVSERGNVQGFGTVKFEKSGQGGAFTIDAVAGDGAKIAGTVKCERFTTQEAVAG
jgi:hypothetical protein